MHAWIKCIFLEILDSQLAILDKTSITSLAISQGLWPLWCPCPWAAAQCHSSRAGKDPPRPQACRRARSRSGASWQTNPSGWCCSASTVPTAWPSWRRDGAAGASRAGLSSGAWWAGRCPAGRTPSAPWRPPWQATTRSWGVWCPQAWWCQLFASPLFWSDGGWGEKTVIMCMLTCVHLRQPLALWNTVSPVMERNGVQSEKSD